MTSAPTTAPTSALALTGRLAPRLNRGLWLLKMFTVIPHFVVLAALWVVFVTVTFIAGVSILVTGRYPRPLFDLNTGILRWNWRVGFYGYAMIGTDAYPPFSLRRTEYPADLEIAYPERMSRGLVLVKWLLAVPHLVIVGLLGGTIMLYPIAALNDLGGDLQFLGGYSVLNLLVVIAGFFLLITGSYPGSLFDFLMGINRWMYRVLIYTALMSDQYPPFRLDAGATEKELS
ncbi:MAG TPA: DUF4389 domain-containing protein [Pseudolysinimonas sp.]|jgi:hypothetical protein|nr:DUF4389 domain-containing protein [Pseudolysinimonas sp.]